MTDSITHQDAKDAARYRWLCDKFSVTKLPCAIERIIEGTYVADGKDSIDSAIDAAMAAASSGEAALAALPGDKQSQQFACQDPIRQQEIAAERLVHPAVNDAEPGSQIAGRDGASAAPSDEGSAP